ncbi:hypothetical protein [Chachezhania antarctica]|uniref:hypothetical protein n=1 Tax=Chachezhania antarctica TaxID=2340860 RepID=UPI000EB5AF6A|nr:hypothetical protein [Chachezhania antarctica]|tara:strand:- start:2117 stop:2932 length:816 start_codon:yes stop_codon:yes gene_type:complete
MRIGLLGNSHAGMLIQAVESAAPEGLELSCLVQTGPGPDRLRREGTRLVAEDPDLIRFLDRAGLARELDLAACDTVVMVGMTLAIRFAALLMRPHTIAGWPSAETVSAQLDARRRPADLTPISRPAALAALAARAEDMALHRLIALVREASDLPILIVPQPHPSADALDSTGEGTASLQHLHSRGDGPALAQLLDEALTRYAGQFDRVHLVPRPLDTIRDGFLTDAAFMRGSQRLLGDGEHVAHDVFHANAEYGRQQLSLLTGEMTKVLSR